MKEKRKALGKGLEQLFSDESFTFEELENDIIDDAKKNNEVVDIDLSELRPNPYQPRKVFDEEKLFMSIAKHATSVVCCRVSPSQKSKVVLKIGYSS